MAGAETLDAQLTGRELSSPAEPAEDAPGWGDLPEGLRAAVTACCSPGLQVVRGEPAGGKTHVVATAAATLAARGRRVLLLAPDAQTLDALLTATIRITGTAPVVRAGLSTDEDLQEVTVHARSTGRHVDLTAQVTRLARQLHRLDRDRDDLRRARAALGDFKVQSYVRALERAANRRRHDRATQALAEAEVRRREAEDAAWHERNLLSVVAVQEVAARQDEVLRRLEEVRAGLRAFDRSSAAERIRRHRAAIRLRAREVEVLEALAQVRAELGAAMQEAQAREVADLVGVPLQRAGVEASLAEALAAARVQAGEVAGLYEAAETLLANGVDSEADRVLIETDRPRWQEHRRLSQLEVVAARSEQRRAELSSEHDIASTLLRRLTAAAERDVVGKAAVVAATPADAVGLGGGFDHVLLEGAGRVSLAETLPLLRLAHRGATLVGDPERALPDSGLAHLGPPGPDDVVLTRDGARELRTAS